MRGQIAEVGAEPDVVLDEQRTRPEQADSAAGGRRRPTDRGPTPCARRRRVPGAVRDRLEAVLEAVESELEPAPRARLELRSGSSRRPSLSVGARQSCSRGPPGGRSGRPRRSSSASVPVAVSTTARVPPLSSAIAPSASTGRARDARPRAAPAATAARAAAHATSWPAGAHAVARRRKKRNVTNRSPRPARPEVELERRASRPPATRSAGSLPRRASGRRRRSAPTRRAGRRGRRSRAGCGPGSGRPPSASTDTGWERNFNSYSAGMRRPVGPDEPVGAEVRVVRRRRRSRRRTPSTSRPSRVGARIPWSTHSQTKPPWSAPWRSKAAK